NFSAYAGLARTARQSSGRTTMAAFLGEAKRDGVDARQNSVRAVAGAFVTISSTRSCARCCSSARSMRPNVPRRSEAPDRPLHRFSWLQPMVQTPSLRSLMGTPPRVVHYETDA